MIVERLSNNLRDISILYILVLLGKYVSYVSYPSTASGHVGRIGHVFSTIPLYTRARIYVWNMEK